MKARILGLALLAGATACGESEPDGNEPAHDYNAEIRWTSYGIPHILADDIPSAAFGQGYAFAKLNGCILADQVVKLRGERASFFGAGADDANVDSDFVHRALQFTEKGEQAWESQPDNIRDLVQGYVDGYNTYLAQDGDSLPCGGEPWLRPITTQDLMSHYVEIATLAGARQLHQYIARAQPPGEGLAPWTPSSPTSPTWASAPTAGASAPSVAPTGAAWCSPTRTSRGRAS